MDNDFNCCIFQVKRVKIDINNLNTLMGNPFELISL